MKSDETNAQDNLYQLRKLATALFAEVEKEWTMAATLRLMVQRPLDYLAFLEALAIDHFASDQTYAPWCSELQHRLLITVALVGLSYKEGDPEEERQVIWGHFQRNVIRLRLWIKERVGETHPLDSEILIGTVLQKLFIAFGIDFDATWRNGWKMVKLP